MVREPWSQNYTINIIYYMIYITPLNKLNNVPHFSLSLPEKQVSDGLFYFRLLIRIFLFSAITPSVTMERKRKLDQSNVPQVSTSEDAHQAPSAFSTLGIDPRLLQAVVEQRFSTPTLVQAKTIPLALEGKDILGMFFHLLCVRSPWTDSYSSCEDRVW